VPASGSAEWASEVKGAAGGLVLVVQTAVVLAAGWMTVLAVVGLWCRSLEERSRAAQSVGMTWFGRLVRKRLGLCLL
jgi:hypothetical protein